MSRNVSFHFLDKECLISSPSSFIHFTYFVSVILLLLPLCVFILHHGLQQWRKRRSTLAAPISHSDIFTYHLVTMELANVLGCLLSCYFILAIRKDEVTSFVSFIMITISWLGELFFHILTCGERYLAVVHPIIYLSLRKEKWVRIRNTILGCVWFLTAVATASLRSHIFIYIDIGYLVLSIIPISFFSISVLHVLVRPGPGEKSRNKGKVDQSKQRAFNTIVLILGVLLFRLSGNLYWTVQYIFNEGSNCVLNACEIFVNLPSSLVLPLMFLQRQGVFVRCKKNFESCFKSQKSNRP